MWRRAYSMSRPTAARSGGSRLREGRLERYIDKGSAGRLRHASVGQRVESQAMLRWRQESILPPWASLIPIRTEHATLTRPGPQRRVTAGAVVGEHAAIRGHRRDADVPALGASHFNSQISHNPDHEKRIRRWLNAPQASDLALCGCISETRTTRERTPAWS
jgi:hypothetical protein